MRRVAALCAVYFSFALPVAMLGVAWPDIQELLGRGPGELGVLAGCYGLGRLSMGASSGVLLRRMPFGPAMVIAATLLAVSSLAVAAGPAWPALVAAVAGLGLASGMLESLGSRYIAVAGSVRTAGLAAGSYSIGATVGPALVASSGRWELSYVVAAVIIAVAGALYLAPGLRRPLAGMEPVRRGERDAPATEGEGQAAAGAALDRLTLALSLGLFVAFVGIEVTAGQWTATWLEQGRGLERQTAGFAVSGFFAGVTAGRLLLGVVDLPARLLRLLAVVLVPVFMVAAAGPRWAALVAIVVAGLAVGPMFPALLARTADRVGVAHAGQVSGWQLLAGNTGATAVPALTGLVVAWRGPGAPGGVLLVLAVTGAVLLFAVGRRTAALRQAAAGAGGQPSG